MLYNLGDKTFEIDFNCQRFVTSGFELTFEPKARHWSFQDHDILPATSDSNHRGRKEKARFITVAYFYGCTKGASNSMILE